MLIREGYLFGILWFRGVGGSLSERGHFLNLLCNWTTYHIKTDKSVR